MVDTAVMVVGSKGNWGHLAGVQLGQLAEGDTIHLPRGF